MSPDTSCCKYNLYTDIFIISPWFALLLYKTEKDNNNYIKKIFSHMYDYNTE